MTTVKFPGQKPDEHVKLMVRPHWLVMLRPIIVILFLSIIPAVVLGVLAANQVEPFSGAGLAITAVAVPAYYLSLITWLFIAWIDYYLDVGIITDQRIIDIDQRGLFQRNVAELECRMVQDINADKTGILQTLFNFGDVIVQTAGERPNFTFHAIPRPEMMVDRIRDAMRTDLAKEDGAAEKVSEAAEKMEAAAQQIEQPPAGPTVQHSEGPSPRPAEPAHPQAPTHQPQPEQPGQPPAPTDETPQDMPREYER